MQKIYDTVIIGSGIAGITAAIYLKRANLDVLLIDKDAPGGQLNKISIIENYPGFLKISGPELTENLMKQIENLNIEIRYGNAQEIINNIDYKIVKTDTEEIKAKTIILALGRTPNKLGLENEDELLGKGVSYCALCDGPFFKNKDIAVVGSGNSAVEEAIYLSNICKTVKMIIRSNEFKAEETLINQLKNKENITIKNNCVIKTLIKENSYLKGIELDNKEKINVEGLFIYIGSTPNIKIIENTKIKTEKNFILVNENMETSVKGIYAIGDVIKKEVYQLTTAVSEATIAAISIKNKLS